MPAYDTRPSSATQESILTALAYKGKDAAILTAIVSLEHFDPVYRLIAGRVIEYRGKHHEPPGQGHLDDIFADILEDREHKQHNLVRRTLVGMREQSEHLNLGYVIETVRSFVRVQTLKNGIMQAAERWQTEDKERIEDVERILNDTLKSKSNVIDPGTFFSNEQRLFAFQDKSESDFFLTGIPILDRYSFNPHIGEIDVFIAPPKKGKSWWCHFLGFAAVRQGWPTLHITLENAETVTVPRYLQTMYRLAKRDEEHDRARFSVNKHGVLTPRIAGDANGGIEFVHVKPEKFIGDKDLRTKLTRNEYLHEHLVVKQFPTRSLTIKMLENYLDYLDSAHGFQPRFVIIDAPYLMKLATQNYRLDLGSLVMELRGLAGERQFALQVTHQGNREASEARTVTASHIAEDFSIIGTCDRAMTFSQTKAERDLGLARLFASDSRNDQAEFTVMISQNYNTGQFALDSCLFKSEGHFDLIDARLAALNLQRNGNDDDD